MKHEIEVKCYEMFDQRGSVNIFLKDETKEKYSCLDIIKIKDAKSNNSHSRLITSIRLQDEGLKDGYVLATLGEQANFETGCIVSAAKMSFVTK